MKSSMVMYALLVFSVSLALGLPCPPGKRTDDDQGRCCVFPFKYWGITFKSCSTFNHNRFWCSLDAIYKGQWAHCVNKCEPSPCKNGASCKETMDDYSCQPCPAGWQGKDCDEDIDECKLTPCKNGGTCVNKEGTFTCTCKAGFTGKLCEEDIDECKSTPCKSGGTCVNNKGSFTCMCKTGFTGKLCELDVDECKSTPCKNGATCVNNEGSFTCTCKTGFTGKLCEEPGIRNFQFSFPNRIIYDYVRFDISSSAPSLTAFTLCQWYNLGDYGGTLFSYALPDEANEILLIDYSDHIMFLLGGDKTVIYSTTTYNDQWHHICATWENTVGSWNLYRDGALLKSVDDFRTGHEIESGGILILGQDQDEFGSGFQRMQSFAGKMFRVNLWSSVLSPEQIKSMSEGCFYPQEGDYLGWSHLKGAIVHGDVSIESPTTCSP